MAKRNNKEIMELVQFAVGVAAGCGLGMLENAIIIGKPKMPEGVKPTRQQQLAHQSEKGLTPGIITGGTGLAVMAGGYTQSKDYKMALAGVGAGMAAYGGLRTLDEIRSRTPETTAAQMNGAGKRRQLAGQVQKERTTSTIVTDRAGNRYAIMHGDRTESLVDARGNVLALNGDGQVNFGIDENGHVYLRQPQQLNGPGEVYTVGEVAEDMSVVQYGVSA